MNAVQKSLFALLLSASVMSPACALDTITGAPTTRLGQVFAKTGDNVSFAGQACGNAFTKGWEKTRSYGSVAGEKIGNAWSTTRQKGSDAYQATANAVKGAPAWVKENKAQTGLIVAGTALGSYCLYKLVDWYNND